MISKVKGLSLRNKIFFANAAVIAAVLVFLWFLCSAIFYDTMIKRVSDDYRITLENIAHNIETITRTTEDYARVISQSRGLQQEILDYLQVEDTDKRYYRTKLWAGLAEAGSDIINPTTTVSGMAVFIEDEVVYCGYDISENSIYEIMKPDDLKRAREQQRPTWNSLSILKYNSPYNEKEYVFPVSKLIRDKNTGRELGIVTLFVGENYFSAAYTVQDSIYNGSRYYLVDNNNDIISSSDKSILRQNFCRVSGLTEEQYEICIYNGNLVEEEERIPLLYSSIECRSGWRLFCITELRELASEKKKMQVLLLLILAVTLILLLLISWLIAQTVTKPVYQLLNTMNKIEKEQTEVRVPDNLGGEVGALGEKFNSLMDSLSESRRAFLQEQKLKRKNEYKLLQAQINPHFLYNTMETIASFVKMNMSKEALAALHNLAGFYQLSLSNGRELITVDREIHLTKNYLALQKLRYAEYMDYRICFSPETLSYNIPKLTLQPLVENAIYHGVKESRSKGMISVEGCISGENLLIVVYDTGRGIKEERLQELKKRLSSGNPTSEDSFGLGNIAQRLKLLYGERYKMSIESVQDKFTAVVLQIPLCNRLDDEDDILHIHENLLRR